MQRKCAAAAAQRSGAARTFWLPPAPRSGRSVAVAAATAAAEASAGSSASVAGRAGAVVRARASAPAAVTAAVLADADAGAAAAAGASASAKASTNPFAPPFGVSCASEARNASKRKRPSRYNPAARRTIAASALAVVFAASAASARRACAFASDSFRRLLSASPLSPKSRASRKHDADELRRHALCHPKYTAKASPEAQLSGEEAEEADDLSAEDEKKRAGHASCIRPPRAPSGSTEKTRSRSRVASRAASSAKAFRGVSFAASYGY